MVTSTVRAGISTIINGGDLGDFGDSFKTSLMQSGIDALGEYMAGEIGEAVHNKDINTAIRYLAHASVGCVIGAATASVNSSEESNGFNCASGAGGAVVGEIIGDIYAEANGLAAKEAEINAIEAKLGELLLADGVTDLNSLTKEKFTQYKAKIAGFENLGETQKLIHQLKAEGVDLAKLGAGLAAFVGGGDVNLAADAAENAVENNVFWFAVYGATLLWTAYDIYIQVEAIVTVIDSLEGMSPEDQKTEIIKLAKQLGIDIATDVAIGLAGGKLIEKLATVALNTKMGNEVVAQLNKLKEKWDNPETEIKFDGNVTVGTNIPQTLPDGTFIKGNGLKEVPISNSKNNEILATQRGNRDSPDTYLPASYINEHLELFSEGAVRFTGKGALDNFGTLGPNGGFVMPKSEYDKMIMETGGNLRLIEQKLELDINYFGDGSDLLIAHIAPINMNGLRLPSGNEVGAFEGKWIPGGYTKGGIPEAVMDFENVFEFDELFLD